MTYTSTLRRRGFTLAEILVSLVILGIIGMGFVRLIVSQSRFTEKQMSMRNARTVSRNAMNILLTDLRMIQDRDGLIAASTDSVTVRVPVAFGLICAAPAGTATISLMPVDSAMTALGVYDGWAYREPVAGTYTYMNAITPVMMNSVPSGLVATCTAAGITPLAVTPSQGMARTGRVVQLPDVGSGAPGAGMPAFLFQQVTYKFDSSAAYPSPKRFALFRTIRTAAGTTIRDEIIAPFDSTARFRFYVLSAEAAQSAVPADLNTVRGLELVLAGSSPRKPQTEAMAQQALVTAVFFKNRRDP